MTSSPQQADWPCPAARTCNIQRPPAHTERGAKRFASVTSEPIRAAHGATRTATAEVVEGLLPGVELRLRNGILQRRVHDQVAPAAAIEEPFSAEHVECKFGPLLVLHRLQDRAAHDAGELR